MARSALKPPTVPVILKDIEGALALDGVRIFPQSEDTLIAVVRRDLTVKIVFDKNVFSPHEQIKDMAVGQMVVIHALGFDRDGYGKQPDDRQGEDADTLERETGAIVIFAHSGREALQLLRARGIKL